MFVTMKTEGGLGIGNYNQSVPIIFDCALCGQELEPTEQDGVVEHPTEVDDGFFRKKMRRLDCKQAGMRARAVVQLPNI